MTDTEDTYKQELVWEMVKESRLRRDCCMDLQSDFQRLISWRTSRGQPAAARVHSKQRS